MTIDPKADRYEHVYKLLIGAIVPRPIALVSTISKDGIRNLAPFSFFTAISSRPTMVCFCPGPRPADSARKDTLRNIEETREFVINVVSRGNGAKDESDVGRISSRRG